MVQDRKKYLANVNMLLTFGFHAIYWLTEDILTLQTLMFHGAN
jgi:hypothetical protein